MLLASPALAIDVMVVHTDEDEISSMVAALDDHPEITVVNVYNGEIGTPTAGDLEGLDAVYAHSNVSRLDNAAIGNLLADFVDSGGGVVTTIGRFGTSGTWMIGGRFDGEGYMPMTVPKVNSVTDPVYMGDYDTDHPIMDGASNASTWWYGAGTLNTGNVVVTGYGDIACDFDLSGASAGTYGLEVSTSAGQDILEDGFTVNDPGDDDDDDDINADDDDGGCCG